MKILLGQSYFRVLDPKELKRQMPYPPLGSLYAATILKKMGHEVIFYDAMLSNSPKLFLSVIDKIRPDLLLIYDDEFNYLTKMCLSNMRNATVSFIKQARALSIPTLLYSSDASDFPNAYLNAGCEAIIYGEGETTLIEAVNRINENRFDELKNEIEGLKFIKDGNIFSTLSRKLISDLDSIPDPDYTFVSMDSYKDIWIKQHGYFSLNISTTRGCPYECNWCAKPLFGRTYTSRTPFHVVQQIKSLKENYSIDHIWMTDDIFGLKTNWIKEFSEELKKSNIVLPYKCLSRPDILLKGSTLQELKDSGCKTIWIGAESGSQKILDAMDKGTKVEQIYSVSRRAAGLGMDVAFFIQFGYPEEDWNDIKLTRKMIRDNLPADIGISVSYPLPGTKFYNRVRQQIGVKSNWNDSGDLDMLFTSKFEKSFYKELHRFVHIEYGILKILARNKLKNIPRLIFYLIKYILLRTRIQFHLQSSNSNLILDQE